MLWKYDEEQWKTMKYNEYNEIEMVYKNDRKYY
jgi:hypothetical protein